MTSGAPISTFASPATLTIQYTPAEGVTPQIYYLDPVNGPTAVATTVNLADHTVSAQIPHFSEWVVGPGAPDSLVLTGTDGADDVVLSVDPSNSSRMLLHSTNGSLDDYSFDAPSTSLSISLGAGDDSITLASFTAGFGASITIDGGADNDTLVGPSADAARWHLTGRNAGTIARWIGVELNPASFTSFERLTGGSSSDFFLFEDLHAGVDGTINGGAGENSIVGAIGIVGSGTTYRPVTWTVNGPGSGAFVWEDSTHALMAQGFVNMDHLIGQNGPDRFIVSAGASAADIEGGGDTVPTSVDTIESDASTHWNIGGVGLGSLLVDPDPVLFRGIEEVVVRFTDNADRLRVFQPEDGTLRVEPLTAGDFVPVTLVHSHWSAPSLRLDLKGGDDVVSVEAIGDTFLTKLAIDLGAGDDQAVVATNKGLSSAITVDGGAGVDTLQDLTGISQSHISSIELLPRGLPIFTQEGPLASFQDHVPTLPNAGAVQAIAVHPYNNNIVYAGTVNGGIWLSEDGGTSWRPLTDGMPSLSIGAIAIAPRDKDGGNVGLATPRSDLVVYAATGEFSSLQGHGGFSIGLLYSNDGGTTWSVRSSVSLAGIRLTSVVPLDNGSLDPNAQTIVVGGLDAGQSTGPLSPTATAAQVQAALEALANIGLGNVTVIGGPLPGTLTVHFTNLLGGRDVPQLIATKSLTGGSTPNVSISTSGAGSTGVDELQTITITGSPTGGTFTLSFADSNSRKGGVFRSTNSGASFERVLPGSVTDIAADPGKEGRIYAGVLGGGVFRSDDFGVTWHVINGAGATGLFLQSDQVDNDGNGAVDDANESATGATRIMLAVAQDPTSESNKVYVALLGTHLMGVFSSTPSATCCTHSWALVGQAGIAPPPPPIATMKPASLEFAPAGVTTDIRRTTGSWRADGFAKGQHITISGQTVVANNGEFLIASVVSDTVLRLTTTITPNAVVGGTKISVAEAAPALLTDVQPQVNLGDQAAVHFAIAADGAGNVFMAGDHGTQTGGYSGNMYVFTAANNQWTQLVPQTDFTAAGAPARPHADDRDIVFSPTAAPGSPTASVGALLTATDGGVYRLDLASRNWMNLNGSGPTSLQTMELVSLAYDALNDLFFGGAQDNGFLMQTSLTNNGLDDNANGLIDDAAEGMAWQLTLDGDGNTALVVNARITDGGVDQAVVIRFEMANNLSSLDFRFLDANGHPLTVDDMVVPALRKPSDGRDIGFIVDPATDIFTSLFGATTTPTSHGFQTGKYEYMLRSTLALPAGLSKNDSFRVVVLTPTTFKLKRGDGTLVDVVDAGTGTMTIYQRYSGLSDRDVAEFLTGAHTIPMVVNTVDPNRTLLALRDLYESSDKFETISQADQELDNHLPFSAVAYGGTSKGITPADSVKLPSVLYAAAGNKIYIRIPDSDTDPLSSTHWTTESIPDAREIRDIVLDPRDYRVAFVVTDVGVYMRCPAGGGVPVCDAPGWFLISQKLFNANLQTIEFVPKEDLWNPDTPQDVLLVGGALGVSRAYNPQPNVEWTQFGANLPTAPITDIRYYHLDPATMPGRRFPVIGDVLTVATQGRGAWVLQNADVSLGQQSVLQLSAPAGQPELKVERSAANPAMLNVSVGGKVLFSAPILSFHSVDVVGSSTADNNDLLTIDTTNGPLPLPGGITFTGGPGIDVLTLAGGKVQSIDQQDTAGGHVITVEDTRGGATWVVTFKDFVETAVGSIEADIITNNLTTPGVWERIVDGLRRFVRAIPWVGSLFKSDPAAGARVELAIIGQTLPRVIGGSVSSVTAGGDLERLSDPSVLSESAFAADSFATMSMLAADSSVTPNALEGITELDAPGISRIFNLDDGTNLLDLVRDGSISSVATLIAKLAELAGAGNVTNLGTEDEPRIQLSLSKTLAGSTSMDLSFEKFGGSATLQGEIKLSVDLQLNLIFGWNATDGFFIETDGAAPELAIGNIQLLGDLTGGGHLGFLDVELSHAQLAVNGVSIGLDIAAPSGNKLRLSDFKDPSILDGLAHISVAGPAGDDAVLTARVAASAILPGSSTPFDLGDASVTVRWADITQPTNVQVEFTGDIGDFLKVKVQELLDVLKQVRDATDALGTLAPSELRGGLASVISFLEAFDSATTSGLSGGTGSANFQTAQGLASRVSHKLNKDVGDLGIGFSNRVLTWDFDLDPGAVGVSDLSATLHSLHIKLAIDTSKLTDAGGGIADAFSLEVRGDVTDIDLFDIFTGGAGFAVARRVVNANVPGGTLADATLMTIGLDLDGPDHFLQIGSDTVGLRIDDGQLAVATLSPESSSDTRHWTAVKAIGLSGHLGLGSIVSATATGIDVSINQGTNSSALNWATAFGAPLVVATGPTTSLTIDFPAALTFVSGDLESLTVANGFVTGSAHFAIKKTLVGVHLTTGDLTNAVLLTLGLSNVDLHIGTGLVNFEVHDGSLAIASLTAPAATAPAPATESRSWLGVNADLGSITFHGIPGLTLDVSALHIAINTANGTFDDGAGHTTSADALDWTQALDLNGNATFGEPVASGSDPGDQLDVGGTAIDFTGALVEASGTARVNVFDLVTGQISFAYRQQTVSVDADGNGVFDPAAPLTGPPSRGPPDLAGATLTTFGLTVENVMIGTPAFGISINGGTLAVAVITPSAADAAAGDTRSWLALTAADISGGVHASPLFDLVVSDVFVQINQASGNHHDATLGDFDAAILDWTTAVDLNGDGVADSVEAGDSTIGLTNDRFAVGGRVTELHIGGFIDSTDPIGFSFSHQHVDVNLDVSVPILSNADLYTFGLDLSAVTLHLGIGGLQASLHGGTLAVAADHVAARERLAVLARDQGRRLRRLAHHRRARVGNL